MVSSRQAQEVQAAMVVAKKFPRDQVAAWDRIMKACKRRTLAENALYSYNKGAIDITGPSIRLAEALAQSWGNIDFGIVELSNENGESSVMAYAWDLETNTRQSKVFSVKHIRHTKKGDYPLTDPREIYEMVANQGARRMRNCILGIIPGDVVDAAEDQCEKTLQSGSTEPLTDRVRKMVSAFSELGVTKAMIEAKLGHNIEAVAEHSLVKLRKIYQAIKDGFGDVSNHFEPETATRTKQAAQAKSDEAAEADAGLAPARTAPKKAPAPEVKQFSVVQQFQAFLDENNFTINDLQRWGVDSGNIPNADSKASLDEFDEAILRRLLSARAGLVKGLNAVKGGGE